MEECIEETANICVPRLRQGTMITKPQTETQSEGERGGGAVLNKNPQQGMIYMRGLANDPWGEAGGGASQ